MNDFITELDDLVSNARTKNRLVKEYESKPALRKKYPRPELRGQKYNGESFYYWFPFFREIITKNKARIRKQVLILDDSKRKEFVNVILHQIRQLVEDNFHHARRSEHKVPFITADAYTQALSV